MTHSVTLYSAPRITNAGHQLNEYKTEAMPMTLVLSFERKQMRQSHMYSPAMLASPHGVCELVV